MSKESDIIIIGAGICGLSIAAALTAAGRSVILLEARDRVGGRIHTLRWHYSQQVEAGAEFIHGDLPLTQALVEKAGGHLYEDEGEFYSSSNRSVYHAKDLVPHMRRVMKAFHEVKEDCTLSEFLQTHFTGEDEKETRERIIRQAEGFDAADPDRVSVFALREEWGGDAMESAWLIREGYSLIADHLTESAMRNGCMIYLSKEVRKIRWEERQVQVETEDGAVYLGDQLICTIPLGVLTADPSEKAGIEFIPPVPEQLNAAKRMGFGPVIKIVLEFRERFWHDEKYRYDSAQIPALGFSVNDSEVPMFWATSELPVITGWIGGSRADRMKKQSTEELFETAIHALSEALVCRPAFIREQLVSHAVFNWGIDPYSKGAYSYRTPDTAAAKKILNEPVAGTLYFAGEALGDTMGTVEAALESAAFVVKKILA